MPRDSMLKVIGNCWQLLTLVVDYEVISWAIDSSEGIFRRTNWWSLLSIVCDNQVMEYCWILKIVIKLSQHTPKISLESLPIVVPSQLQQQCLLNPIHSSPHNNTNVWMSNLGTVTRQKAGWSLCTFSLVLCIQGRRRRRWLWAEDQKRGQLQTSILGSLYQQATRGEII